MRNSRVLGTIVATLALGGATLATTGGADASGASSNSGHQVTRSAGFVPTKGVDPAASRTQINRPNDLYVGHTCKFDLSGYADGEQVSSLTDCGVTATFSVPMTKITVPDSWASWGSPPDTESATPEGLWNTDSTSVTITFSSPVRIAGAEAEPDPFEVHQFMASFNRPAPGGLKASFVKSADGNAGARLFAMKTKNIGSMTLSSDVDFAIANLRIALDD